MQISAVIIAKDEAAHISALAASLDGVVDEVVLLDTGSTDDTVALAEGHGFRVFHRPWADHFADARNAALAHARGEWVLSIDADERLVVSHPDELRNLLATLRATPQGHKADGFFVVLDSFTSDDLDPDRTARDRVARLFRRSRLHFDGRIHEQLRLADPQREPLMLDAPQSVRIQHLGYIPAIWAAKGKSSRNRNLAEASSRECNEDAGGSQLAGLRRFEAARAEVLDSPSSGLPHLVEALGQLSTACDAHSTGTALAAALLIDRGEYPRALSLLRLASPNNAYRIQLWVLEATALVRSGHPQEAADIVRRIEEAPAGQGSNLDRIVRLPVLNAEILAASGLMGEAWLAVGSQPRRGRSDLGSAMTAVAGAAWRHAVRAGQPNAYLAELSRVTGDEEFKRLGAALPEWHQRAAAGIRHRLLHDPIVEPDPRLEQFLPQLEAHSVASALELANSRLDAEPALALGVAETISLRADATPTEVVAAEVLQIRALLLLARVEAAVIRAVSADPEQTSAGPANWATSDIALVQALAAMAKLLSPTPEPVPAE